MSLHDPIKTALGNLTISALKHALQELPGVAADPAWEPLEDCVIEVIEITDTQATVKVAGHGAVHWYNVVVQTQRTP
jgi:hypothetical protein